jgi:RNA recognition motif-containing protein
MTVRIYVGNLPEDVDKQELDTLFRDGQEIQSLKLITNRKTNKCRGFGFVTVKTEEEADALVSRFNGLAFREQTLKVEKALPRSKEDTPETGEPVAKPVKVTTPVERPTPRRDAPNRNSQRQQNRRKPPSQPTAAPTAPHTSEATEPDPRWADALRQLKERLAMQTTGS